ncbi:MAG: hypothetical protein OXR66_02860 [Candidatus Woesearchaeota archaeon]|nr:hypothetical protein [Candidatus Woesearchaeota archaeon]
MYTKTLSTVQENELGLVGQRALDLALLTEHKVPIPHSFVVLTSAFAKLVEENDLRKRIDFLLSHIEGAEGLQNVYTSVRKAVTTAELPEGLQQELQEMYDSISTPGVGLSSKQLPVRLILSTNWVEDAESNDSVIQDVHGFEEFMTALRELWAFTYHPSQLSRRMKEGFNEKLLHVAVLAQVMEKPLSSVHTYSAMPQDDEKIYLQTYYGYPDLRERVTKDYYAVGKDSLHIVLRELKEQKYKLDIGTDGLTLIATGGKNEHDKVIKRHIADVARLTKKAEYVVHSPVKAFFQTTEDSVTLLWVNRLDMDRVAEVETAVPAVAPAQEAAPAVEVVDIPEETAPEETTAEDFVDMSTLAAATEPEPVEEPVVAESPEEALHIPAGPKVVVEEDETAEAHTAAAVVEDVHPTVDPEETPEPVEEEEPTETPELVEEPSQSEEAVAEVHTTEPETPVVEEHEEATPETTEEAYTAPPETPVAEVIHETEPEEAEEETETPGASEPITEAEVSEPYVTPTVEEEEVTSAEEIEETVQGEILASSLHLAEGIVGEKYKEHGEPVNLLDMVEKLGIHADLDVLRMAIDAVKTNAALSQEEYTKAANEISRLLSD